MFCVVQISAKLRGMIQPPPRPSCPTAPLPPPPLRLCSVPRIAAGDGTNDIALSNNKSHTALLTFQCGGDEYYQFGRRILDLHQKLTTQRSTTKSWVSHLLGRRDSPLPGKDKSILFIGNSHTRQQVETLLCQYSDVLESGYFDSEETAMEGKVYLKHNHTIQWVTNNFAFYGHDWQDRLEMLIDKPLADHDAIVVGRFNQLDESWNTTFYQQMLVFGAIDKSIDFEHIKPPNLEQLAAVYSGFLIGVGPYAAYGIRESLQMARKAYKLAREEGRTIAYIDGRKFISEVGEGAAGSRLGLNFCENSEKGQNLHRCTGPYGGIVDVTIWELVEMFHRNLV
jgi:hypothetical protein